MVLNASPDRSSVQGCSNELEIKPIDLRTLAESVAGKRTGQAGWFDGRLRDRHLAVLIASSMGLVQVIDGELSLTLLGVTAGG